MEPTVVDLRVWGVERVLPAVARVARQRRRVRRAPGLVFATLLGTGRARTFSPRDADPHHWALLTTWSDATAADAFAESEPVREWQRDATEELWVRMRPLTSRGRWSRRDPFPALDPGPWDGPVAALTRARLRATRAASFWRAVPPVAAQLAGAPGSRLALGIGEAPVGVQGTFSLWSGADDLTAFAYRPGAHREVVRRTEPARWYAEELFARLAVLEVHGSHDGVEP
ncbi:hypothetical protein [Nocardioides sp. SYSU D00038]|uniref:hypothetical protein n=1 Tax=Nocardioides sp. SYSU D00038 TaxID=2812554 RepID=UPI0019675BD5|nr:hypothetical protein [Nocardioides sp. SYSU D00038]